MNDPRDRLPLEVPGGRTLNPGDELVWAPHLPHAFEAIRFVGANPLQDRVYVVSRVRPFRGELWMDTALFIEMCFPLGWSGVRDAGPAHESALNAGSHGAKGSNPG